MKITNKTNYDTNFLRKLFIAIEKHDGTNHKYREVEILKTSRKCVHGKAWYNSRYVNMYLPNDVTSQQIARVYIHEVGHNLGLTHVEMVAIGSIDVSWLPDEMVPLKKPKLEKPKPNIIEVRTAKAQKKLKEWTRKEKRAKTFVKKYRQKVKYYEKKMAAGQQTKSKEDNLIPTPG